MIILTFGFYKCWTAEYVLCEYDFKLLTKIRFAPICKKYEFHIENMNDVYLVIYYMQEGYVNLIYIYGNRKMIVYD